MPDPTEPWLEKTYTLTPDELRAICGIGKIKPKRKIAPGLMILAVGAAIFITLAYPFVGSDSLLRRHTAIAYLLCGAIGAAGALYWKAEGAGSVRRQMHESERLYSAILTNQVCTFDDESWTLRHEDGSEEKRSYSSLRMYQQRPEAVLLITDFGHVLPARLFTTDELEKLRQLCQVPPQPQWRRWNVVDYALAILDRALWKHGVRTFLLLIGPIVALPICVVRTYTNPGTGVPVYSFFSEPLLWCAGFWYTCILFSLLVSAEKESQHLYYGVTTESGYTVRLKEWEIYQRWPTHGEAREGFFSFLIPALLGGYHLFAKRTLTPSEKELLRGKIAALKHATPEAIHGSQEV